MIFLALPLVAPSFASEKEFTDCDGCPVLVKIPTGSFQIRNAPWGPGHPHDEGFYYTVTFAKPFAFGKFELTNRQWQICVEEGVCADIVDHDRHYPNAPVVNVSWHEVTTFMNWLSKKTGYSYRLPSNAEWEYASRAGLGMNRYFDIPLERLCEFANTYDQHAEGQLEYGGKFTPCDDGFAEIAPVGQYSANAFGIFDSIGNVSEWTEDCASPDWRGAPHDGKSWVSGDCSLRGFRGASWLNNEPYYLLEADRFRYSGSRAEDLGFRVLRDIE